MITVIVLKSALKVSAILDLLFEGELCLVLPMLLKVVLFALNELLGLVEVPVLVIDTVGGLEGAGVSLVFGVVPQIILLQRVLLVERVLFVLNCLASWVSLIELLLCSQSRVLGRRVFLSLR